MRVEGNLLVVRDGTVLPPRCIKTNAPVAEAPVKKTLYWATPALFLLILINILVLLIVYLIVRKKCQVQYYISPEVKKSQWIKLSAAAGTLIAGVACIVVAIILNDGLWVLPAGVLILTGLVLGITGSSTLRPVRHRDGEFWLKGCGPAFLASVAEESALA